MKRALVVIAVSVLLGCTAKTRFSYDPNQSFERYRTPKDTVEVVDMDRHSARDVRIVDEIPRNVPTRIDVSRMNRIIANYLGTPYQSGGTGKLGIDCSGLAYVIFRDYDGTRLPLTVQALYRLDQRVDYDDLSYGDLVFFRMHDRKVSHVGIYLDNGKFVHASETRGVTVDSLLDEFFAERYAGARRVF